MKNLTDYFNKNGITLIALVITIIVMLILSTIAIQMILGDNGILSKAKLSKIETEDSASKEQEKLDLSNELMDNYITSRSNGGITYCDTPANSLTTSTASLANPCVVVESYRSGTTWCRVWSDGWIEQSGYIEINVPGPNTATYANAMFVKQFSDTNYTVTLGRCENANDFDSATVISSKANNYVRILAFNIVSSAKHATYWYASGY